MLDMYGFQGSFDWTSPVTTDENPDAANAPIYNAELKAVATLLGPFRLKLKSGRDITPSSPLRQSILAVLITANGQTKSRRVLLDMFWGATEKAGASANLRTALYLLKKDLSVLGEDLIAADRNMVCLAPRRIEVARSTGNDLEFLEGMEIRTEDCEGFEEWLRDMRLANHPFSPVAELETPQFTGTEKQRPVALGILPTIHADLTESDLVRMDAVSDTIARFVARTSSLDLHDLRGLGLGSVPLPLESGSGPTHLLQALGELRGKRLLLSFRLHDAATKRIVWISDVLDARSVDIEESASTISEAVLEQIARIMVPADTPDLFPWTALTALFSLDEDNIARMETKVEGMVQEGAPAVLECLVHFAQVFRENEGVGSARRLSADRLRDLVATVPEADPLLPLWQSLAGYSAHMLLGENDLADLMLRDSYRRAPSLSLNLDHLAVLRMVRGDMGGAEKAFRQCQRVGASSPWRYTYDVTGAMISMAKGDYLAALQFANQALLRKPRFIGALRYAMAGLALSGNTGDAKLMHARIQRLRPDYDLGAWTESMIRRTPYEIGSRMVSSLSRNGFM
ncbi:hypothetical protein KUV47_13850 [Vannielia litorea]|uniref:hypothetical protein n=1 Tax=Vannielia litorea TaxID=1217970 RepID=UPI001C93B467|nr:hypothetical protein [Vannielia litorea]MBY6154300.1 hypothetical protein [Vannielia litorea]